MGYQMPESKRQLIKVDIALNCPTKTIAKATNMSTCTVQVFRKNVLKYGTLRPSKLVSQGLCILCYCWKNANKKSLLDLLCTRPSLSIDEQIYYLWDVFGLQVNEQSTKYMLKRVKWSKKQVLSSYIFASIFGFFLTCTCKYVLHNVIQNSGKSGCIQQIGLCLLMNQLQMREQAIENVVGLLSVLHLRVLECSKR